VGPWRGGREEDRDNNLTFSSMGNPLGSHEILGRRSTEVANSVSLKTCQIGEA